MSNTNGVIAAPVSIYDVQHVLGQGSNDLATLCVSTAINRWARYKPERWAGTTAAQKQKGVPQPIDYATRKFNNFSLEVPFCYYDQHKGWKLNVMAKRVYDIIADTEVLSAESPRIRQRVFHELLNALRTQLMQHEDLAP